MRDEECVHFLQSVLPCLHLSWPGFRKVRSQVCKRVQRRIRSLDLDGVAAYRQYLEAHSEEWQRLDALCRISISRFYRDKQTFVFLEQVVLPDLAQRARARADDNLKIWCAGVASGEEAYTLAIIWQLQLQQRFPQLGLQILATDADPRLLQRGRDGCYGYGSIKNLPEDWRNWTFSLKNGQYCLKLKYKEAVKFRLHDVRQDFTGLMSAEAVDLVLCRNLAFTYFDEPLQQKTYLGFLQVLKKGGALVLGIHEQLPQETVGMKVWSEHLRIYQKTDIH